MTVSCSTWSANELTAMLLPNGKVLIAGGLVSSGSLSSAEPYDPAAGRGLPPPGVRTAGGIESNESGREAADRRPASAENMMGRQMARLGDTLRIDQRYPWAPLAVHPL